MALEPILKYKINRCAQLLAESALNGEIKQAVMENIGKATEDGLDKLIDSLEREKMEMERFARELGEFEKEENEQWGRLEREQKEIAQRLADEFLAETLKGGLDGN